MEEDEIAGETEIVVVEELKPVVLAAEDEVCGGYDSPAEERKVV